MASKQVTIDDLWIAAQWLDYYEEHGGPDKEACARVSDMLHRMARERETRAERAMVARKLKAAGRTPSKDNIDRVIEALNKEKTNA